MIQGIIKSSLEYRFLVLVIVLLLMIYGITQLPKMPIDALPEFDAPVVEIQTEAVGLSAEEVESLITLNIEEFLSGVPWLQSITSESISGLSSVRLTFEPGTDLMRARQVVQESLSLVYTLPNVSKPPIMLQPISTIRRAMMVGISSKTLSPIEVSVLTQWTIKPRLLAVPGVANVIIWGKKNRELQVQIDPKRLKEFGLTQDQIIKTTGEALWVSQLSFLEASLPGTGGWIDTPNQRLGIRHVSPISTPEDLARLPIEGTKLRLGEVAKVIEGHQPLVGETYLDGNSGLVLVIEKFLDADTMEVTRGVERALHVLQLGLPGLEIDTNYFQLSNYIESAISHLGIAMLISAVLIVISVMLFLYSWRAALISLFSISLSFVLATLILYWSGSSLNLMILAGFAIALGVIIDDQIAEVENIIRHLREHRTEERDVSSLSFVMEGILEIKKSTIYASLILIIAILPIFFLDNITGRFFHPLAFSYTLALIASMIVALSVTPILSFIFLRPKTIINQEIPFLQRLQSSYESAIAKLVAKPNLIYIFAIILLVISVFAWPFFNTSLLPQFRDKDVLVEIEAPPGTSHPAMTRIMQRIIKEIREAPGVKRVVAHSGHAVTGDQITGMHSSQIWVNIDPKASFDQTFKAVEEIIDGYQGFDREVQTYVTDIARDAIIEDTEAVIVRIYGSNREILSKLAEEVKKHISEVAGVGEVRIEGQVNEPHIEVRVDMVKAAPHGIKPGDVRRAASTVFAGITVGNLFENQKIFDVVVWGIPQARNSIKDIQNMLIDKPGGGYVRLGDVADVKIVLGPTMIAHESISPYIDIIVNASDGNPDAILENVKEKLKKINFPLEYHPEILGEIKEVQQIKRHLFVMSIFAAIVIFFVLQACFNSWILALLTMLVLPMALVGGVLTIIFSGNVISLASLIGLLAVLGIAVRQIITLITHFQQLEQFKGASFGRDLVIQGTKEKLVSILMTAFITMLAFLPFIFLGNVAGLEIIHPMGIVVIGGLITSTLLILFLIPPLYLLFGSTSQTTSQQTRD